MIEYKKYPNTTNLIKNIKIGDTFVWREKDKNKSFYWIFKKRKNEILLFHIDLENKRNEFFWYDLNFANTTKFLKIKNRF